MGSGHSGRSHFLEKNIVYLELISGSNVNCVTSPKKNAAVTYCPVTQYLQATRLARIA